MTMKLVKLDKITRGTKSRDQRKVSSGGIVFRSSGNNSSMDDPS